MSNSLKYLDKNGLTYFWGKVKGIVNPKATKVTGATAGHIAKLDSNGDLQDGGIAADNIAQQDGTYAGMTVGNLTGPVVQTGAEFTWRKTAGTLSVMAAGGAVIEKIMGRSLVWNQQINPSGLELVINNPNAPATLSGKVLTLNSTNFVGTSFYVRYNAYTSISGHKYYVRLDITPSASCSISWSTSGYGSVSNYVEYPLVASRKNLVSRIENNVYGIQWFGFSGATPGQTVRIDSYELIDLTLMFGSGNEPSTVEEFEAMFPLPYYDYNEGTLISNDASAIETVGFNLWDEEWENGQIDSYGQNAQNENRIRTKNYIPVFPGVSYYFKITQTGGNNAADAAFYDKDKNFLSYNSNFTINSVFTTPAGAYYLRFTPSSQYGKTYNHDICINLSDASRNGQYEPYQKSVLPLNISTIQGHQEGLPPVTIFPNGLLQAGDVRDEIGEGYAIKRVGSVDLGTLDWGKVSGDNWRFEAVVSGIKKPSDDSASANILCGKYDVKPIFSVYSHYPDKIIGIHHVSGAAWIYDTAYSSSTDAQFKADMSGVILYYELATPEYYTLEAPLNLSYPCDGDGTEARLPADTASSVLAPFRADIRYAMNGMGTLQRLDDNYIPRKDMAQDAGNDPNKTISQQATTRMLNDLASRITLSGVPADLSYYDVSGSMLLKRETANMYVVRGKGLYKIPLVYGNGIHHGKENPAAYTRLGSTYTADFVNHLGNQITSPFIEKNTGCTAASVGLLWQTGTNLIDAVDLIDGNDCRYLRFSVANVPATNGLAVLYVKDANDAIMWSWTIWLCNDDLSPEVLTNYTGVEYAMMPEAIGTLWNAEHTTCFNPHYQWGRKDPMCPPAAYNSTSNMTLYDISGNTYSGFGTYGVADDSDAGGTTRSVANSIQLPNKFFLEYDATNHNWNNLAWFNNFWNAALNVTGDLADNQATAIKTIYDPCPAGFMLPAGRVWTGFTTTGTDSSTASEFNVIGSFSNGWNFKKNSADAVGTYYPASGYRSGASGGLGSVGSGGNWWSYAPYSQLYSRYLYFASGYVYPLYYSNRASGFSVRPSVELT